ncbi:MAG: biotin/lipoyl-containing protein, partial [Steroidobacteraceae bacterium]
MTTFHLPDLGEGLQEADIVAWHIKEGETVQVDQLMVSVETAKAVVEVPSPFSGTVTRLLVKTGDTVATHQAIVEFDLGIAEPAPTAATTNANNADAGTVVGRMNVSDHELVERAVAGGSSTSNSQHGRLRTAPAARLLAKRLEIDLSEINATGKDGVIS